MNNMKDISNRAQAEIVQWWNKQTLDPYSHSARSGDNMNTITGHLTLADLHNPDNIIAVLEYRSNRYIEAGDQQGFQETPGKIELWSMETGRLLKVCGWLKTSVAQYAQEKAP